MIQLPSLKSDRWSLTPTERGNSYMLDYRRKAVRAFSAAIITGAGFAGLAGLAVSGAAPAHADPGMNATFVAMGSNTLTDIFDAFTGANPFPGDQDANGNPTAVVPYTPLTSNADTGGIGVSSWDATAPGNIASAPGCTGGGIRLGGPIVDRANGSGAGIESLGDALGGNESGFGNGLWRNHGTTTSCTGKAVSLVGQMDLSRSSKGPSGTPGTVLQFVPFARDALSYAYFDHSSNEIGLANSLTTNQIAAMYSDLDNATTQGVGVNAKGVLTLTNGHTVVACALNPNSGTTKDFDSFLTKNNTLGFTINTGAGAGTAQQAGLDSGCDTAANPFGEENRGDDFYNRVSAYPVTKDAIVPYGVSSWIEQHNGIGVDNSSAARLGGVSLGDIGLITSTSGADLPYDTTGCAAPYVAGNWCPDVNYYSSANPYARNIYAVLNYAQVFCNTATCAQNPALAELFTTQTACPLSGPTGGAGTTCDVNNAGYTAKVCQSAAQTEVQQFGFSLAIAAPDSCGDTLSANSTPITG